jgi:hypothetical protein
MNNKNLNENILGWIELGLLTAQLGLGLGHIRFSVKNFLADRKKRKQIEQLISRLTKTNPELVQKLKTLKPSEPVPGDISSEIKSSLSPEELQLFDTIQESKINMNQENQLRQLIRESIQEYIREIDEAGNRAALEAKMTKTQEAIDLRKKKLNMEGLDEAYHDMMDKGKMKEMTSEIKMLEKSLAKYGKMLEKMDAKNAPKMEEMKDDSVEEEMIDEVSIDENDPESGPQLEEETEQVYEMLLMQKRAGIISETEYKAKVEEAKKKMTDAQKDKKEDIVKGMKKSKSFGKSKDEKSKMYATATKLATKKNKGLKEEVQALFEEETKDLLSLIQSYVNYNYTADQGYGWVEGDDIDPITKRGKPVDMVDYAESKLKELETKITNIKGAEYFTTVKKIASLLTYDAEYANAEESEEIQPQLEELAAKLGFTLDQIQDI